MFWPAAAATMTEEEIEGESFGCREAGALLCRSLAVAAACCWELRAVASRLLLVAREEARAAGIEREEEKKKEKRDGK